MEAPRGGGLSAAYASSSSSSSGDDDDNDDDGDDDRCSSFLLSSSDLLLRLLLFFLLRPILLHDPFPSATPRRRRRRGRRPPAAHHAESARRLRVAAPRRRRRRPRLGGRRAGGGLVDPRAARAPGHHARRGASRRPLARGRHLGGGPRRLRPPARGAAGLRRREGAADALVDAARDRVHLRQLRASHVRGRALPLRRPRLRRRRHPADRRRRGTGSTPSATGPVATWHQVAAIGLLHTQLQRWDGVRVWWPNARLAAEPVANVSRSAKRWEGLRLAVDAIPIGDCWRRRGSSSSSPARAAIADAAAVAVRPRPRRGARALQVPPLGVHGRGRLRRQLRARPAQIHAVRLLGVQRTGGDLPRMGRARHGLYLAVAAAIREAGLAFTLPPFPRRRGRRRRRRKRKRRRLPLLTGVFSSSSSVPGR